MKDTIKIALLAVIAVTLIVQTIGQRGDSTSEGNMASSVAATPSASASAALPATTDSKPFDPTANAAATPSAIDNKPKTTMVFNSYDHDFGNIKQDSENKYVFSFTNTGKEPLIIESATGSCGCTVPNYPKEPIAPGATGQIDVVYKPGKQENLQNKTVTVVANTEPKQTTLRIKANVEKVG